MGGTFNIGDIYPPPPARWNEYAQFAHEFDGYAAHPNVLGTLANAAMDEWNKNRVLSDDFDFLRSCLFYEARRSRFVWGYPSEKNMGYLDALYGRIQELMRR